MDKNIPLHQMYSQRENFVIVALTGITGSGCSKFADMMSMSFEQWQGEKLIRSIDAISDIPAETKQGEVFKRAYQRCYQLSSHYETFQTIKYKNVLIFYTLKELFSKYGNLDDVVGHLSEILAYFVLKRDITDREEIKKIRKQLTDALKETMLKLYQEDKKTLRDRMRSTWLCRMICGN